MNEPQTENLEKLDFVGAKMLKVVSCIILLLNVKEVNVVHFENCKLSLRTFRRDVSNSIENFTHVSRVFIILLRVNLPNVNCRNDE